MRQPPPVRGALTVVGTGFRVAGQITVEALAAIHAAERLFFLVSDPATRDWLAGLPVPSESLYDAYSPGRHRRESYAEMRRRILAPLATGTRVCAAFYGHPGVFASVGHDAIRTARAAGLDARMLPGVSALDCLVVDLEFDPGAGCQMFESTDFLLRRRVVDPTTALVLWQVGAIGRLDFRFDADWGGPGLGVLADVLVANYGANHPATIYEAAMLPGFEPRREVVCLADLGRARVTTASTLFVPAARTNPTDDAMRARLKTER